MSDADSRRLVICDSGARIDQVVLVEFEVQTFQCMVEGAIITRVIFWRGLHE